VKAAHIIDEVAILKLGITDKVIFFTTSVVRSLGFVVPVPLLF
jgi:hypothetical protein